MPREMRPVPYDSHWPVRFEEEATALRGVLDDLVMGIHHIGSTSVPGLEAKPIIDICIEVRDLDALDARDEALRALGYVPRGEFGIPGRRYYPKGGEDRTHHVHAYVAGSPLVVKHLVFRDYLRTHTPAARAYEAIKREASAKHLHDSERYTAYKHAFIAETLLDAEAWARLARGEQRANGKA